MDFAAILDKWEKQSPGHFAHDKDARFSGDEKNAGERRFRLLRKKPDDSIDLHGLTRDEAWAALETFFENSRRKGFEKLLVIHGKGNHGNEAIIKDVSLRFMESCAFAGERGFNSGRDGGTGATWVILKEGG